MYLLKKSWLKSIAYAIAFAYMIIYFSGIGDRPVVAQTDRIEIVAQFPLEHPPGNLAITPQGRLIMSQHQFYGAPWRVVEIEENGKIIPFPNQAWSSPPGDRGIGLNNVLGLGGDQNGILWMLDRSPGKGQPGKIVAWDTINDELHRVIYLAQPIIKDNSFLNDLAVDLEHHKIYITDTATGTDSALIIVDLETGFSRRVLEGDISTRPEDIPLKIDNRTLTLGGKPARVGANPIAIDPQNQWVYYAPMSGTSLYRIATEDLANEYLSFKELSSRVERYGEKPICDGIAVDSKGNVYITSITDYAIGVVTPNGKYRTLYQDDKLLSWANGLALGKDNYVYVTASQLQNSPPLNNGENNFQPPFYILKFPTLASLED